MRRLVTARIIDAVDAIDGADAIEVVTIGGWKVVVKKGEFKVGDQCLYFEIDSFLQDGVAAWQFLVDKQPKMFMGNRGHKLRTIRLRGQVSQGFVVPIGAFELVLAAINNKDIPPGMVVSEEQCAAFQELKFGMHQHEAQLDALDMNFSAVLGVVKYELPLPTQLQGLAEGLFPSFIRKTDQERCQNLKEEIFGYEDQIIPANAELGRPEIVRAAKADRDAKYEVTLKLDGSSMTVFGRKTFSEDHSTKVGVCSRNLELKISEANMNNGFVQIAIGSGLIEALKDLVEVDGVEIAVQGELMAPGIQSNRENLAEPKFFVFDIFDIKTGKYLGPTQRRLMVQMLQDRGVRIEHVPVLHQEITLQELGITDIQGLLAYAEGPSMVNPVREGLVFKRTDGSFSFKAISNKYLQQVKD